jgi:hypothetical protein
MDMKVPGTTTMTISVGPPTTRHPRGGNYNRMEKLLVHRKEPWDDVLTRLLDYYEDGHK